MRRLLSVRRWRLLAAVALAAALAVVAIATALAVFGGWLLEGRVSACDPLTPKTCEPLEHPCLAVDEDGRLWTCEGLAALRASSR